MAITSVWVEGPLEEAAAIVQAEWIRLHGEALWQDGVTDRFADLPEPRTAPAGGRVATRTARPWPGPSRPDDRRRWPTWRPPARPVWATQRSPPLLLVP